MGKNYPLKHNKPLVKKGTDDLGNTVSGIKTNILNPELQNILKLVSNSLAGCSKIEIKILRRVYSALQNSGGDFNTKISIPQDKNTPVTLKGLGNSTIIEVLVALGKTDIVDVIDKYRFLTRKTMGINGNQGEYSKEKNSEIFRVENDLLKCAQAVISSWDIEIIKPNAISFLTALHTDLDKLDIYYEDLGLGIEPIHDSIKSILDLVSDKITYEQNNKFAGFDDEIGEEYNYFSIIKIAGQILDESGFDINGIGIEFSEFGKKFDSYDKRLNKELTATSEQRKYNREERRIKDRREKERKEAVKIRQEEDAQARRISLRDY
ncbi:MAG: hypothetical protein PHO80_04500 [Candidatus Gracilibacteria bacterium]|nr:hypothetical protein [Candidatus Gracilibacteria bacterium]MDD4530777.1 hypothetical protein [Candidatus Gracilibacteria bacterium]